jgi:lysophospholipase L1-like esterase
MAASAMTPIVKLCHKSPGFFRHAVTLVTIVTAFTAFAACADKTHQLARLGPDDVVLAFGDSLTYGTGAAPEEAYPNVLGQLIRHRVVGAGVPGETTSDGLARLPAVLDEVQPRLLLLCMGGNDMLRRMDAATTEANLRAMAQLATARGIGVVLIGVPEPVPFGATAKVYTRVARELDIALEQQILQDVLFDRELKSDQIHPNARGYRRIAQALADLLQRAGAL